MMQRSSALEERPSEAIPGEAGDGDQEHEVGESH